MQDGASARAKITRLVDNVSSVILGKRDAVEYAIIALICGGHVLIEDVPGVGKTMLARSVARSTGCSFGRIQFTPDLLPSDITGVSVYNQQTGAFEYRAGPIMAQMVLADELNRTTPKTQSALLEAMDEHQVTVDGVTHTLPRPTMVLATLNPIEYEGTSLYRRASWTVSCCASIWAIRTWKLRLPLWNSRCCATPSRRWNPS